MTITVYEAKQVELSLPAYYRKKGTNITNWYLAISETGSMITSNGTNGNVDSYRPDVWLDSTYEPCSPDEFFCALAANTAAIVANQQSIAKKWGLISLQLKGGTPC